MMSLKNKLFSTAAVALAVGFVTVSASAQSTGGTKVEGEKKMERKAGMRAGKLGKGMRGNGIRGMRGGMFRGIELTETQKQQINAIRESNKLDTSIREEMRSIMQARRAGTITEDQKARAQVLRQQQQVHMENVRMQMESILTPEQKQQIEAKRAERQQRMEQRLQQMKERRERRAAEKAGTGN
jgi:Spy/CpxP family protein refolding chaperone